jgi:hypothetical protein
MKLSFAVLSLIFISCLSSVRAYADLNKTCDQILHWIPGQAGPADSVYQGEMNIVDYNFYQKHKNLKNWILVDARGDGERKDKGIFENVLSLRSALKAGEPDDFTAPVINEKLQAFSKSKTVDFKNYHFILFCNGEKCPKSALAGCKLRNLGLKSDQVNLLSLSFLELKAKGI